MANNNSLRKVIETNADCVKFVKHFDTKNFVKHILKNFNDRKNLEIVFTDEHYGAELIGYGKIRMNMGAVLADVFSSYIKTYEKERREGNTRSFPDRVDFIIGLVDERMKKTPGKELAGEFGDFIKSKPGKEIETIAKSTGNGDEDTLMDILLIIALKYTINDAMSDDSSRGGVTQVVVAEEVDDIDDFDVPDDDIRDVVVEELTSNDIDKGEPIDVNFTIVDDIALNTKTKPEHRAHVKANCPSPTHALINRPENHKSSKTDNVMGGFYETFEKMNGLSDYEIKNAIRSLRKYIENNWGIVKDNLNNISSSNNNGDAIDDIMSVLPDRIDYNKLRGINIEKLLESVCGSANCDKNNIGHKQIVLNIYMAVNFIECVVELDNENEFVKYMFNIVDTVCKLINDDEHGFIGNMKETRSIINDIGDKIENKKRLTLKESINYMGNYGLVLNRIKVKDSLNYIESIA